MRPHNVVGPPLAKHNIDGYPAFDALPEQIRHALHEAVNDWDAVQITQDLIALLENLWTLPAATNEIVRRIRQTDRHDVRSFAARWRGAYPAVAAGASLMRYDEASRHSRR